MNNFAKLIKSKIVSFIDAMINSYKELELDEVDTMILIHLHNQITNNHETLSVTHLAKKMSIKESKISERVLNLIKRGFIELNINDDGVEIFNIDATYEKLGCLIEDEDYSKTLSRADFFKQIVAFIETTFQTVIKPTEAEIINAWIEEKYTLDEIKEATLECVRSGKPYINYIDRRLVNKVATQVNDQLDEKTYNLLNNIYVKNRG